MQSCEKSSITNDSYLVAAEKVNEYTKNEFNTLIDDEFDNSSSAIPLAAQSGIQQYKITYRTKDTFGNDITASGALVIPTEITSPLPLVSYQHGTIFDESQAPSYFKNSSEAFIGSFLASSGFIVCMPDYIGYGASKNVSHPYEHANGLAEPSIDLIRAAKEFIVQQTLNWNKKLMMMGYSEGGYATMAMHKSIEKNYPKEFDLQAVSCGAGAYDKTNSLIYTLEKSTTKEPAHLSSYIAVLKIYNTLEKLNRPISYYFKSPYATQIESSGFYISLDKTVAEIVNDEFKTAVLTKSDKELMAAFARNDIYDWKPKAVLRLYHGDADTYVPYLNTENAYNAMKKRNGNVTLYTIPNGTHSSSIFNFFVGTLELLNKYK